MTTNQDQAEFWAVQHAWVTQQDAMDACLAPVLDGALLRAEIQPGERVLDIGCGTGDSLLALAARVGVEGYVLGADISPSLLALARERIAGKAGLAVVEADAQVADFEGDFDLIFSRFGVMFFEDTSAAFANLARALKPQGRFSLAVWGDARQNPFFMDAAKAARSVLGEMPKTDRTLPGPFAFEDPAHVREMLGRAGLKEIEITPTPCALSPRGDVSTFADLCMQIGPAVSAMRHFEANDTQRKDVRAALEDIFAKYATPKGLRVPALINYITARI